MLYYLDADQLAVLHRVKTRLYDEMTKLTADDRRDLANAMDAVLHHVETYGLANEPDPPTTLDVTGTGGKATVEALAVIKEYLDWGAANQWSEPYSSDRYLFEQKFRALLGEK